MYAESGPHKHRNGEYGPPVEETMAKLLGILAPSPDQTALEQSVSSTGINYALKSDIWSHISRGDNMKKAILSKMAPNYAHLDPDDIPSRIPDILWKLQELEKKDSIPTKVLRYFQDVEYIRVKVIGTFIGIIFPLLSLFTGLGAISPRQKSLYFGVIVGHGIDFMLASIYCWWYWYSAVPPDCDAFGCDIPVLQNRTDFLPILKTFCNLTRLNMTNPTQVLCFCNGWHYSCSNMLEHVQDAYMFLGALFVVMSFATITYAKYLLEALATKKYRMRGGV